MESGPLHPSPSASAFSSALVHVGARVDELDRRRHERFIREKLLLTGLVLAALPLGGRLVANPDFPSLPP